jgi:hypothetical protein
LDTAFALSSAEALDTDQLPGPVHIADTVQSGHALFATSVQTTKKARLLLKPHGPAPKKALVNVLSSKAPCIRQELKTAWSGTSTFLAFQAKVQELDQGAIFSSKDRHEVLCGRCGKPSLQQGDNDITRLIEHRKSESCKRSTIPMIAKLDSFFSLSTMSMSSMVGSTSSSRAGTRPVRMACPGIGKRQSRFIPLYILDTAAPSGGAPPRFQLEKTIIDSRHAAGLYPLSESKLFDQVKAEERSQAVWINHSLTLTVTSPHCLTHCLMPSDGDVLPCYECAKILKVHTFQNALNHVRKLEESGKVKDAKFTPISRRDPVLGDIYARQSGLKELLVCQCLLC